MLLPGYLLVLFRIGGLCVTAPLFGSAMVPRRLRVGLAFVLAAALFPMLASQIRASITFEEALIGVAGETMIGLIIGLAMSIVFVGAELAGSLVGQQAGLSLGQVLNPLLDTETTAIGQLFFIVHLLIFLAIGGQRHLMRALLDTFEVIPLLSFRADQTVVELAAELLSSAFILAIRLAGPVLTALTLTTLALGLLSRAMPQLNVLSIGFTVQILVALLVAALALSLAGDLLVRWILEGLELIRAAFGLNG